MYCYYEVLPRRTFTLLTRNLHNTRVGPNNYLRSSPTAALRFLPATEIIHCANRHSHRGCEMEERTHARGEHIAEILIPPPTLLRR